MSEEQNTFTKSLLKYQGIIDTMLEHKNKDGICVISQKELGEKVSIKQNTVSKAIRQINTEEICIEMLSPGKYIVHYRNIMERGTFACIWNLFLDFGKNPQLLFESDKSIAERYGYKLKTVQMFKAYTKISYWEDQ